MSSFTLTLANTLVMSVREIRRNKLRSTLTTLGIVIGVAAVIALMTLGDGATRKVTAEISNMGVNMLTVTPGAARRGPMQVAARQFELDDARAIERNVSSVAAVAPSVSLASLAVYGNKNWNTLANGTTNAYFQVRALTIESGRGFSDVEQAGNVPVCVLGATVRRELFGRGDPLGTSIRIGRVSCRVIGIIQAKGQSTFGMDQDDFVLMPIGAFQRRILGRGDVGAIAISAVDESSITRAKNQITALMHERRRVAEGQQDDFEVRDTREIVKTLQNVTGILTTLLTAVAAVSLLVGGIGIMNIMLVSVTERTREIGIRLAIGAREREVLLQFLVEAIVLSVMGGMIGMLLGLVGSYFGGNALGFTFRLVPGAVVLAVSFSVGVGIAFGFFPARKAARLNPIEALRHE